VHLAEAKKDHQVGARLVQQCLQLTQAFHCGRVAEGTECVACWGAQGTVEMHRGALGPASPKEMSLRSPVITLPAALPSARVESAASSRASRSFCCSHAASRWAALSMCSPVGGRWALLCLLL